MSVPPTPSHRVAWAAACAIGALTGLTLTVAQWMLRRGAISFGVKCTLALSIALLSTLLWLLLAEVRPRDEALAAPGTQRPEAGEEAAIATAGLAKRHAADEDASPAAQADPLTGLPSPGLLNDRLEQAIERAKRHRQQLAVLILELDGFAELIDKHGRAGSDQILKIVAGRLRRAVRATDSVFRVGGSRFVLIFGDLPSSGPIVDFARKIVLSLLPPVAWDQEVVDVSASIGVATYPDAGATPKALLVYAEIEMSRTRQQQEFDCLTASPVERMNLATFPGQPG